MTGWTQIKSQLSGSYWINDADESIHVYRRGRVWVRAKVVNGLARDHTEHASRKEAMGED